MNLFEGPEVLSIISILVDTICPLGTWIFFEGPEVLSIISILVDTICPWEPGLVMNLFERPEVLSIISRTCNIEVD